MKRSSHDRRKRLDASLPADGQSGFGEDRAIGAALNGGLGGTPVVENDLANATLQVIDRLRPHFNTILVAIGAVLAAVMAYAVVSAQAEAGRAQSWDACLAAMSSGDVESFNEVVRRYPGTPAAQWAEILLADAAAAEGTELLFIDRKRAEGRLQAAVELYLALIAGRPRGLLAERAVFGLAKARESLGQLAEAQRGYEAVAAEFPADALAGVARARAVDLGRESTRQWYDWFGSQQIAPPAAPPVGPAGAASPADAAIPATPAAAPASPSGDAPAASPQP